MAELGWKTKTGVSLAAVLAALLLLELGVRLLPDSQRLLVYPSSIPGVGYQIVPDSQAREGEGTVSINRWGFRGEDFPEAKPEGERRVVVLGDSVAYGQGWHGPAFAELLGGMTGARVINTAVPSYSTCQEWSLLNLHLGRFAPDAVVVAYVLNDPEGARTPFGLELHSGKIPAPFRFYHWLKRKVRLIRFIKERVSPLIVRWRGQGYYAPKADPADRIGYAEALHADDSPFWAKTKDCLARLGEYGKTKPVVFMLFPFIDDVQSPRAAAVYDKAEAAAAAAGLQVAGLRGALAALPERKRRELHVDGVHLTGQGHQFAAEVLAAYFRENKVLR